MRWLPGVVLGRGLVPLGYVPPREVARPDVQDLPMLNRNLDRLPDLVLQVRDTEPGW